MNQEEKNRLALWLASLDGNERLKVMKRAAQLRKSLNRKLRSDSQDEADEDGIEYPVHIRTRSLDDVLWTLHQEAGPIKVASGDRHSGLVIEVGRRFCRIQLKDSVVECELSGEMAERQQSEIAVGDDAYVIFDGEHPILNGVSNRRTVLSRPDVGRIERERVIVANVDTVVIVTSVVSPPLHPKIIDRYMIAIQRGGCRAAIVVNKLDLLDAEAADAELAKLEAYRFLGLPVVPCSAATGGGIDALRTVLAGQLSAFVGHSGVGKSSLINALQPGLDLKVGSISEGYGRGTHTTTRSSLLDLGGFRVVDTPGIRSFGLWKIKADDLPWYFPEFEELPRCRFSDCRHVHEPGCSVKGAAEANPGLALRYATYLRILEGLA